MNHKRIGELVEEILDRIFEDKLTIQYHEGNEDFGGNYIPSNFHVKALKAEEFDGSLEKALESVLEQLKT